MAHIPAQRANHLTMRELCVAIADPAFPVAVPAELTAQQTFLWTAHEVLVRIVPEPEVCDLFFLMELSFSLFFGSRAIL